MGADPLGDFEAADDLMLGMVRKRVCEECVESFIDASSADDAGCAEEGAKRQSEALRSVEKKNCIEAFFVEGFPKGEKMAGKGLFEEKEFVDVGIVFQDLHANRTGEDGDVGMGKRFADIFDRWGRPKSIS